MNKLFGVKPKEQPKPKVEAPSLGETSEKVTISFGSIVYSWTKEEKSFR